MKQEKSNGKPSYPNKILTTAATDHAESNYKHGSYPKDTNDTQHPGGVPERNREATSKVTIVSGDIFQLLH